MTSFNREAITSLLALRKGIARIAVPCLPWLRSQASLLRVCYVIQASKWSNKSWVEPEKKSMFTLPSFPGLPAPYVLRHVSERS